MKNPLISVIIPVYNHDEFIAATIESVLGQTFKNYEIIIIDDGSTDQTRTIVAKYHPQIRYIYKNHMGTSSALNVGIQKAKGQFICWLSSDDQFLPTKLERQVNLFQLNPTLGMVHTDWYETDAIGNITRHVKTSALPTKKIAVQTLLQKNCINGSTVMLKAACFEKTGFFNVNYLQAHDHDMWLKLCRYYRFGHIAEPLLLYRRHHKNLSLQPDPLHNFHHKRMFRETKEFFNYKF